MGKAGLDIFAHEPDVPKALWEMDNVVLQPASGERNGRDAPIHYHTINRADLVKNVWRLPERMVWSTG